MSDEEEIAKFTNLAGDGVSISYNEIGNPFKIVSSETLFRQKDEENQRASIIQNRAKKLSLRERAESEKSLIPPCVSRGSRIHSAISKENRNQARTLPRPTKKHHNQLMPEIIQQKREIYLMQLFIDRKNREILKFRGAELSSEKNFNDKEIQVTQTSDNYKNAMNQLEAQLARGRKVTEQLIQKRFDLQKKFKIAQQNVAVIKSDISKAEDLLETYAPYYDFLESFLPEEETTNPEGNEKEEQSSCQIENKEPSSKSTNTTTTKNGSNHLKCGSGITTSTPDTAQKKRPGRSKSSDIHEGSQERPKRVTFAKIQQSDPTGNNTENNNTSPMINLAKKPEHPLITKSKKWSPKVLDYFHDPEVLMNELHQIENENLFIVKQCQYLEEVLNHGSSKITSEIFETIKAGNEIIKKMKDISGISETYTQLEEFDDTDSQLKKLEDLVNKCYINCFETSTHISTMSMLEKIEKLLEDMYSSIQLVNPLFLQEKQMTRDRERREQQRKEWHQKRNDEQQRKMEQAIERAKKPIPRRTGRPVVSRIIPVHIVKANDELAKKQELEAKREEELLYKLSS